jgi:Kdo2-lipid IVA lauroyltransferase/acyltransferase
MQLLIYIIIYPLLWLVSLLPFRVLYILSDCVCFFIYTIFGYRKKIVRDNLALALPLFSEKERLIIEKKFFHHFCDIFLEMIKTMTISESEIIKRYSFSNLEVLKEFEAKQKSIILMCGHYASYEWAISINKYCSFKGYGIYKKVSNKYFDQLAKDIRSRFKATLITTRETKSLIEENHKNSVLGVFGFASDQSPQINPKNYWAKFMGIEVPVYIGAEELSKKYDMNILFLKTKKVKRGFYETSFEVLTDNPKQTLEFEITNKFLKLIENQIQEAPEFYLWSHNRWKHRKN